MKVTEKDIIQMAQTLRDEENQQLKPRSWNNPRRHLPLWIASVSAAAVVGFVLGVFVTSHTQTEVPLLAKADTIYVEVPASMPDTATAIIESIPATTDTPTGYQQSTNQRKVNKVRTNREQGRGVRKQAATRHSPIPEREMGRSVAEDRIRYDLLAHY